MPSSRGFSSVPAMSTRWNSTVRRTPFGLAHVESDDTRSTSGCAASTGRRWLPDEAGGAGDRDRHAPPYTDRVADDPQPGDPEEPDESATLRTFRPSCSAAPGNFDPADVRLLPDRPQPGDADPAVDRTRQLGDRPPDRRVGRARGSARARRSSPRTASSSRSSRTRRRRSWSARPDSPRRSRTTLATVGPQGWVDLHLDGAAPGARGAGHHARRRHATGRRRRPRGGRRGARRPARLRGHADRGDGRDGRHGQHDGDARARAARRAGGLDDRLPRAARARSRTTCRCPPSDAPSRDHVRRRRTSTRSSRSGRSPRDDLRFYVALHETVHAAVRSVPWLRERLVTLATQYVSSYEIDPSAFEAEFGMIDPQDPESLQRSPRARSGCSARCSRRARSRPRASCSGSRR